MRDARETAVSDRAFAFFVACRGAHGIFDTATAILTQSPRLRPPDASWFADSALPELTADD
ncbi:MAG: hypothetical protein AB7K09_01200 [Planctomycetota bacterium]